MMLFKYVSMAALTGTLIMGAGSALSSYAYLDDAPYKANVPQVPGPFPKIMLTETQSVAGPAEQFTKYDLVGVKAGMLWKIEDIQALNPDVELHYGFDARGYQGEVYTPDKVCELGAGMPFGWTGPATEDCAFYAGHWLYYPGTQLQRGLTSTDTVAYVKDASRLTVGEYVVIYDAPAGSFENAEHTRVVGIDRSTTPHKVTLASRGFKSTARYHGYGSIIAQHVQSRGYTVQNWAYNTSLACPRDANNRTIAEVMANWLDENVGKKGNGVPADVVVDGIYFDSDSYFFDVSEIDIDNDLVADAGISDTGVNLWGEGLEYFYSMVRDRFPNIRVVGGTRHSRGFGTLNGTQLEGWPTTGDYKATIPNYTHDGFDSNLQRYKVHLQYHTTPEGYVEQLSKAPTRLYPHGATPPNTNAAFRFSLASSLLGESHFGTQNSSIEPDPWWDEYAVDVKPGSPTYGRAIASNPDDESAIRAHKGWLGYPIGPYERVYDEQAFDPGRSLLTNGGFETGINGWRFTNINASVVSTVRLAGQNALNIRYHQEYTRNVDSAKVTGEAVYLTAGKEYTLAFAVKATKMREISVRVQGIKSKFLVPTDWTRVVHTFKAETSGWAAPTFLMGRENIPVYLDEVYLFEGNANVFVREFDNGIVVVNATPSQRWIDLGQPFQRIRGTGQDPINNGATITSVTLPAYDAAILVRPEYAPAPTPAPAPAPAPVAPPSDGGDCGAPTLSTNSAADVFVWEDTCSPGRWHLRALSGQWQPFPGTLTASGGFANVTGVELEPHDVLDAGTSGEIAFVMKVGSGAVDGVDFDAPAGGETCLTLDGPSGVQLKLGESASPAAGLVDINIRTGRACGMDQALGSPDFDQVSERAAFVWKDEVTGQWHVRVGGGGYSGLTTYRGGISNAPVSNLKGWSVESHDTLTQTNDGMSYVFKVWNQGEDGFSVDVPAGRGACLSVSSPDTGAVYLGQAMVPVVMPLNLDTLGSCTP